MPVSPQDFALWSRMTGNPYPQSPAERMALAPEVYSYTRNIGRQGGPTMSPIRRAVDVAGKVALGAGLLAGASYLATKGYEKLELDNEPDIGSTVAEAMPNVNSQVAQNSGDVTGAKTSDNFNQKYISTSTEEAQLLRGTNPQKPTAGPIEQKPATQSKVIGSQQHFTPGTEEQQLASAAQPSPSIRDQAEELIGRVSASQVAKFRQSPSYAAAVKSAGTEELIGDTTPYVEPSPQPAVISGPVRMTPQTRVAVVKEESPIAEMSTAATPVDVGSALKSKGIYLSGDLESGTIQVNTDKGGTYEINHPYSTHPKSGIRETALQEEQMARDLLQSVGVTPEQAKEYWSTKTSTLAQPKQVSATPATVTSPSPQQRISAPVGGASSSEIRELDQLLARSHARHTPEQRIDLRNQLLAKKYGGGETIAEAPAQVAASPIITTSQPQPVRVSSEVSAPAARISPNEFLSAMSQQVGPVATYDIPADRSKAVRGLAFYPGGEIGVKMPTKAGTVEYAYQSTDPYRLSMGDYAEEGFPATMGPLGGLLGAQGSGRKIGLRTRESGGTVASQQPEYLGLMPQQEIARKLKSKVADTREQAQQHAETKIMLQDFASRYPQPPMSAEEKDRLRAERTPAAVAKYRAGVV